MEASLLFQKDFLLFVGWNLVFETVTLGSFRIGNIFLLSHWLLAVV